VLEDVIFSAKAEIASSTWINQAGSGGKTLTVISFEEKLEKLLVMKSISLELVLRLVESLEENDQQPILDGPIMYNLSVVDSSQIYVNVCLQHYWCQSQ